MYNDLSKKNTANNGLLIAIKDIWSNKWLYLFVLPGLIWFLVFCYYPMYGVLVAFKTYDPLKGILGSSWAPMGGFKYFIDFFQDINFKNIMINTVGISLVKMVVCFPAPIIFALLLNEIRANSFKRLVQSISYLPYFISWVVVFGIFFDFFSVDNGIINNFLIWTGLIKEPVFWLGDPKYFWGISTFVEAWKNIGFNSVIYLAAIASINIELFDSAIVDGASRFRQVWHIILPSIKPTILMLLILSMGTILNGGGGGGITLGTGFEQIYIFSNPVNSSASTVIDTYVMNQGIFRSQYALSTAVGLFKSAIGLIMLLITNYTIKALSDESLV
jgi:ABC-type polysaccharide transport system, permease component